MEHQPQRPALGHRRASGSVPDSGLPPNAVRVDRLKGRRNCLDGTHRRRRRGDDAADDVGAAFRGQHEHRPFPEFHGHERPSPARLPRLRGERVQCSSLSLGVRGTGRARLCKDSRRPLGVWNRSRPNRNAVPRPLHQRRFTPFAAWFVPCRSDPSRRHPWRFPGGSCPAEWHQRQCGTGPPTRRGSRRVQFNFNVDLPMDHIGRFIHRRGRWRSARSVQL